MKKRLLFWINGFILHFELAYYLQQQIDDEFFAIIDIPNNPKKMFLKQKLVNFKKTWYFHDEIKKTNKSPDLEYMSNFEKKYNIDLWKLAINERYFYRFNRFYKFSKIEILQILEQECRLFEEILDEAKPEYLLIYDPPFHHQKLLLDMCKSKGIKILCLYISRIGGKSIIASDGGTFDLPQDLNLVNLDEFEKNEITIKNNQQEKNSSEYASITKTYKIKRRASNLDKFKALIDYIFLSDSMNTQASFMYYGRDKLKVILDNILLIIKRRYRSYFMQKNLQSIVDLSVPYVYFPMNIEEELSVLHYAPFFTDQIEVIKHVAKSLPIDYNLYVKEHPFAEFRGWNRIDEYKEIMDIPNVTLIHHSFSSEELIKQSKLVVTLRGTGSFDCLFHNKPSLVFGDVPFSILPSVYTVDNLEKLPKLIEKALKTPVDPQYLQKYIKLIEEKTINFSMMDWEVLRNNQFFSGNTLSDIDISEEDVKQFFSNTKEYFKPLLDAYLEKINF